MDSSPEVTARRAELERTAPVAARGAWTRTRLDGAEVLFLCGTIGAEFDCWQRRLAALSAADALLSQQIGLDAVEKVMDELEERARREVEGMREEGRAKSEEGRAKSEEGRAKSEEGRGKRDEGRGKRVMPRRSPGYGDLPLSLSRTIINELDAPRRLGVSITDSGLLVPSKSVTAICEIV